MTEINKRQTFGQFEARGIITVTPDTFQVDLKGKNNTNFNYSRINMKMEDDKGGSFYINAMDGFDVVKGKTIYANIKDSETNEQMQVAYADRLNPEILKHIDDKSFVRVALRKVDNGEGKMVWEYNNFLSLYDAINFLKPRLETGMKLYVRGNVKYSMYNGNMNTDQEIKGIYLVQEDDTSELGFKFSQSVIVLSDSLDDSKFEEEGLIKLNAKVRMRKKKDVYETLTLPLTIRSTEENKEKVKRMADKFLTVGEDTVRRIRLEGKYNIGYVAGNVTEEDLPAEALELIEDGFYTKSEVLNMYANRSRVNEMLVTRPVIIKRGSDLPKVDMSDDEFKLEDLIMVETEPEIEIAVETSTDDDLSFLDDLD